MRVRADVVVGELGGWRQGWWWSGRERDGVTCYVAMDRKIKHKHATTHHFDFTLDLHDLRYLLLDNRPGPASVSILNIII